MEKRSARYNSHATCTAYIIRAHVWPPVAAQRTRAHLLSQVDLPVMMERLAVPASTLIHPNTPRCFADIMEKSQLSRTIAHPYAHEVLLVEEDESSAGQTCQAIAASQRFSLACQVATLADAGTWLQQKRADVVLVAVVPELSLTDIQRFDLLTTDTAVVLLLTDVRPQWTRAALITGAHEYLRREVDLNGPTLDRVLAYAMDKQRFQLDLSRFVSSASHDLQAPARQIRGFVRLLRQRLGSTLPTAVDEPLQYIEQAAEQQRTQLEALVQFARIRNSRVRLQRVPFPNLVERAMAEVHSATAEQVLQLDRSSDGILYGDPDLLQRALVELLDNAVRYRRGDIAHVQVRWEDHPTDLCLVVTDDGLGMSETTIASALQPFRRRASPQAPTTGCRHSLGLGLNVCRRVAEAHRGALTLTSQLGNGTTVRMWLPREPQD